MLQESLDSLRVQHQQRDIPNFSLENVLPLNADPTNKCPVCELNVPDALVSKHVSDAHFKGYRSYAISQIRAVRVWMNLMQLAKFSFTTPNDCMVAWGVLHSLTLGQCKHEDAIRKKRKLRAIGSGNRLPQRKR
jgi:hypothetical protein